MSIYINFDLMKQKHGGDRPRCGVTAGVPRSRRQTNEAIDSGEAINSGESDVKRVAGEGGGGVAPSRLGHRRHAKP